MGSNLNFKNFGNNLPGDGGGGGRPPGGFPLTRQSSIYSLTFEEFQSTVGGSGKDFGSMNMDELLKNIWSAEENQNFGSTTGGASGGGIQEGVGYLQRQGSLTLPRTLSQKTVDEVWRDMSKEYGGGPTNPNGAISGSTVPQRQKTFGEITLEEFLVKAGVVREDAQLAEKANNVGFFGDLWHPVNNSALGFGYQQQQSMSRNGGLMGAGVLENSNQIGMQSANLPLNVNGGRSAAQQQQQQQQQQILPVQQQQQQILPKQPNLAYGAPMGIPSSNQLGSPRIRGGIAGISDPVMKNPMVQNATLGGLGMVGLGANGSPSISSDGLSKSNGDTPSVSPVPYVFNGGLRGRKTAALEKVVERRQRRMIKNRESAARSRARKQAYTTELEAEVAKLKEEHEELQKKQVDIYIYIYIYDTSVSSFVRSILKNFLTLLVFSCPLQAEMEEMQKNQVLEMMKQQNGAKRRCLRRTQTGPW
ncbi:hypothetical protein BUALT_Bualt08G0050200 [Buddleja alternifolia]|uniref:BZIP domain-containing protein n=1 Tax=Buddleja alternifolia TaxID=168488 RepID=A0AAV6XER6_9LAMI|nr:hypothetical protein BUALT_Bualt08G0050200 [Buddleja alternifolia]